MLQECLTKSTIIFYKLAYYDYKQTKFTYDQGDVSLIHVSLSLSLSHTHVD